MLHRRKEIAENLRLVIFSNNLFFVVGQAKIGKKHLLQQLFQKEISEQNYKYIFYVSLKDIDCSRKTNLINFLTNEGKRFCRFKFCNYNEDQVFKKVIQHFIKKQKKICIILDDFENVSFYIDTYSRRANNCEDLETGSLLYNILKKINTAYCDKFLGNTPRNLIWNNIDYILYNVVRRAIATRFDLVQGSHQATCLPPPKKKKTTLQYATKIYIVFQSRMHSKTAQQNNVKVPTAQFKIAYCPS